jgi:DEAD/DEAH box helicase domain-containing protein
MIPSIVAEQIKETLEDYLDTTFRLSDIGFRRALFDFLRGPKGIFRGPYVDVRLPFQKADEGTPIPLDIKPPFTPYAHQLGAFQRLTTRGGNTPQHTLVTTGTGSGKTECFLFPILDHCYRHVGESGVKAIILYPMNALASDQARRLAQQLWKDDRLRGRVRAGLFIGGRGTHAESDAEHLVDQHMVLRQSPPDILLTNYKMLDFLLMRPDDRGLWRDNSPDTLRYLVLDELHTYDGAQGSDVACLIRRLRARLRIGTGSLACVGTSATIASADGSESASLLRHFAGMLFGEALDERSVVQEIRCEKTDVFRSQPTLSLGPTEAQVAELDASRYEDAASFVDAQSALWLGQRGLSPVDVGERLLRHRLLHHVILSMIGGLQTLQELAIDLTRFDDVLKSLPEYERPRALSAFLSLVSYARVQDKDGALMPFLATHVQLWVRELRRLTWRVPEVPEHEAAPSDLRVDLEWTEDVDPEEGKFLPIVHCRECGVPGYGAIEAEDQPRLHGRADEVGRAYLTRDRRARFVLLGAHGEERDETEREYLCPQCLHLSGDEECPRHGKKRRVTVSREVTVDTPKRFLGQCPACGAKSALRLLGARAPSLASVAIAHIFLSPFNDDKKLLAFTDSVQDASHLASFFGSRAYRFNLRSAVQQAIEATPGDVGLHDIADVVLDHWCHQIPPAKVVATFLPPDLDRLAEARRFLKTPRKTIPASLRAILTTRLSWEIALEFGYQSQIGRTLEITGCATAYADVSAMDRAADQLAMELSEQRLLGTDAIPFNVVRAFLDGVVYRLRVNGGIEHEYLRNYIEKDGDRFALSKRAHPHISTFAPDAIPFRFFYSREAHETFESYQTRPGRRSWVRDWASRALSIDPDHAEMNRLYSSAIRALEQAGIVKEVVTKKGGSAASLRAEALHVTSRCLSLRCAKCQRQRRVPAAHEEPTAALKCFGYRCDGVLLPADDLRDNYYARRYRSGGLERIFAREHTGLLKRAVREKLEEEFKGGTAANAPNLLTCTPTLEMGIDIGDLSAGLLCSTPRSPANYLQRIGRSGRRTGNALTVAMARARPHDLYFFSAAREMMVGEVVPPGCFLDAPEILKRQLVAFAMDSWARDDAGAESLPRRASDVMGALRRDFPGRFITYYRLHAAPLFEQFATLFAPHLSAASRERLQMFADPDEMASRIDGAFTGIEEEVHELLRIQKRLLERRQALEKDPVLSADADREKRDIVSADQVTDRLRQQLMRKYPLNVLTDAGVLPNYAFPEPGVTLRSAVRQPAAKGSKEKDAARRRRLQTFEYLRPASAALRELAPFNTFYAEGRKVQVTEIDVGTTERPLIEQWRFCPACHFTSVAIDMVAVEGACPHCGDAGWADTGQVRDVVNFKRASAFSDALADVTTDDAEDREQKFYRTLDLIDVRPEHWKGGYVLPDLPFGFELLSRVRLREVNLGEAHAQDVFTAAGQQLQAEGFLACKDCGRVAKRRARSTGVHLDLNHAPSCSSHRGKSPRTGSVFLYRQLESEALRVLLPAATVLVDEERAAFQAALCLGLRRKFRGNPDHILFKVMSEPAGDEANARRTFLYLYDAVPGGTGYLAELARRETFLEVLTLARGAILQCRCRATGRDGCHRCVLGYASDRDLRLISARRAAVQLGKILNAAESFEPVKTLSDVKVDSRLESELERRFLEVLVGWAEKQGWTVTHTMNRGEETVVLANAERRWTVRPQLNVGPGQGVELANRPDFVLEPSDRNADVRPIAVFCDGLAYHALPDAERGRIADDFDKRSSIAFSNRFVVWSLTWRDIEAAQSNVTSKIGSFFDDIAAEAVGRKLKLLKSVPHPSNRGSRSEVPDLSEGAGRDLHLRGAFDLLTHLLRRPSWSAWQRSVRGVLVTAAAQSMQPDDGALDRYESLLMHETRITNLPAPILRKEFGAVLGSIQIRGDASVLVRLESSAAQRGRFDDMRVVLRLDDTQPQRVRGEFELAWRTALHAFNLLQFHEHVRLVSSEQLVAKTPAPLFATRQTSSRVTNKQRSPRVDDSPLAARNVPLESVAVAPSAALTEALEAANHSCHALLRACESAEIPMPAIGDDIASESGEYLAHPELFWTDAKVALFAQEEASEEKALQGEGWETWTLPINEVQMLNRVRERLQ